MSRAASASPSPGDVPLSKVASLEGHDARVWHCAWNCGTPSAERLDRDGAKSDAWYILATCGADTTVKLWSVASPSTTATPCATVAMPRLTLEGSHTGTVRRVCFSPDGKLLASASFDKTVVVWNVSGVDQTDGLGGVDEAGDEVGAPLTVLEGHESEVKGVAWNPSGNGILATCGRDKTVWFWEQQGGLGGVGRGSDVDPVDLVELVDFEVIDVKHGHDQDVKSIAWHPSGDLLVSVSYDDSIKFWRESDDTDEWECVRTVAKAHESTIWDVRFDENGGYMVTSGDDCCVKVWAVGVETDGGGYESREVDCTCLATLSGYHDRPVYSADVVQGESRDRLLVASGGGDDAIVVVEVDVAGRVDDANERRARTTSDDWKGSDISVGEDGDARVNVVVKAVASGAHGQDVNCVRWRPRHSVDDVYMLASCGDDGAVGIWTYRS